METEKLTIENLTKPSKDGSDFLETLLWIATENEKDERAEREDTAQDESALEGKTIFDFSPEFTKAVSDFCWDVRDEIGDSENGNYLETELEKCSRSFGGNLFFTLTGHGCGFFDESNADGGALQDFVRDLLGCYRFEELEHNLILNENGKIDLCFSPDALGVQLAHIFHVPKDGETSVLIRKFPEGDTIAFFPCVPWSTSGNDCASYQKVGQHGSASLHFWNELQFSTDDERAELVRELESIGYNVHVENFWTGEHDRKHRAELNRLKSIN